MIIWLASYPKSGNTWIRLFLDYLLHPNKNFDINKNYIRQFPLRSDFKNLTTNINNQLEFAKNCIPAQNQINLDKKIKIFKTHNAFWNWNKQEYFFTDEQNTLGVIYIVRDPRNIITSILNYFNKKNYEDAFNFMKTNRILGGDDDESGLPTIIGSWGAHYTSWKKFKKNYFIIKYEDLLNNPHEEFLKLTNFLISKGRIKLDKEKILESIKFCKFENFSNQEDLYGFDGNTDNNKKKKKKFFNLGPNNKWQNLLDQNTKELIEDEFKNEMKELGYL